ncbi:hypothetical protein TVAG_483500 [Trichomonas vaginalis G3]|uniref:Uncharacterized protein n=1 Tax=Trichomonas vaginalis (strain ATCC PRA-98 / G3) TaxID=412133 RepID=A2ETC2_TRIV3|nr:hypothetical protein TVAGG3_0620480 [Trichomonas vaginalis G3]EAY04112.1 hypothetical protein TVAG_483500 [Trichomonas vaginalis G3]KAI5503862.1 hypothetical protein TVAGG3_0620480 [Trichomonas vaginalis G3]|eukprot:XP_001316335.1 hypothetical protein [Trichomonas vaginalis G3]
MSEENQPIFADTAPDLKDAPVVEFDERQYDMLKDNLVHQIDEFNPRIEQLKQTYEYLANSAEKGVKSIGIDIIDEIQRIRPRMESIHNTSIAVSKRIQALGLNQQTISTLAIPKQMRPVHEEFFSFKDEFDAALKNVAQLSRSVTTQYDNISDTLNGIKHIPENITKIIDEIETYRANCYNQAMEANNLKSELENTIIQTFQQTLAQFDQKTQEAEKIIDEYEAKTKNGVTKFEESTKNIEEKKEDLKNSYANLSSEIMKSINEKIDNISSNIRDYKTKSDNDYQMMHKKMSVDLDEIHILQSQDSLNTVDEYISQEKEIAEVEILTERLNRLQKQIEEIKCGNGDQTSENEPEYKDYKGIWQEKNVIFRCHSNGEFEVIESSTEE